MNSNILIINGSPNGMFGQSQMILETIVESYQKEFEFKTLVLSEQTDYSLWEESFNWAQGFIFLTGTYWDSWRSPLQNFFEKTSHWEVSSKWLGKPAAVIVTMHSVGGKAILSRLQGVLNTMGVLIPPMSGIVYSLNTHLANQVKHDHSEDFWHLNEIELLLKNLNMQIKNSRVNWHTWDVDKRDVTRPWLKRSEISIKS